MLHFFFIEKYFFQHCRVAVALSLCAVYFLSLFSQITSVWHVFYVFLFIVLFTDLTMVLSGFFALFSFQLSPSVMHLSLRLAIMMQLKVNKQTLFAF